MKSERILVGVDIGGTFTDIVVQRGGALQIHKLLSTPSAPAEAMLAGLTALSIPAGARISHGTTVATNAILERKGARTALLMTAGFRDILAIGRQNRPQLYALQPSLPPPLIPPAWCYDIPERLDYQGQVIRPLDLGALDRVLDALAAQNIESVAVCLLYSYLNPQHERAIRERMRARGWSAEQIALSSEVLPQFREYERASTTSLDAYIRPIISRYLSQLEAQLPAESPLWVMKSDGGVISAAGARGQALHTALSGPAAGLIGAAHLAKLAGYDHIITLDMGGTSTDVALCPGQVRYRPESAIDGLPLRIPLLDIETVGAGGGSLARVDAGGVLRVGPDSAGANPGPVIYGRGGEQMTLSDANALLGRLEEAYFLDGQMDLDIPVAQAALGALAGQLGLSPERTALGIVEVANVHIDRAIRRVSIARGHDPRQFTLFAFGGAGGLHACEVAERLGIPRVLIPRYPGVLCALGLLLADVQQHFSRAIDGQLDETIGARLESLAEDLRQAARAQLRRDGFREDQIQLSLSLDLRYQGQSYELPLAIDSSLAPEVLAEGFHALHTRTYGYRLDRPIEVINLRLLAQGGVEKPDFPREALLINDGEAALIGHKPLLCREGWRVGAMYLRELLRPGAYLQGPALILQQDSTSFIPPGWALRVDEYRNLIIQTGIV